VDAHTPKGALLGIVAASLAGVPVRIYHVHGLRFVTSRGLRRRILRGAERLTSSLATRLLCVSRSVATAVVSEGFAPADKVHVVMKGSINGVDAERFRPATGPERCAERAALGIPSDALVIGYVGRIAADKGIAELMEAWSLLRAEMPDLRLLVVGARDGGDDISEEAAAVLRDDPRCHTVGGVSDPEKYYRMMDVLALPTYREGFGVVLLEAGATGLPAVATRVQGCVDAVVEGVTGTLVPERDARALANGLRAYLQDPALRRQCGA
jgi:glycosyltransferase involved in cell wall biosynthesis